MKNTLNKIFFLSLIFLFTGCSTVPSNTNEGVKVEVTKVVTELVTIPESLFENCRKPKTVKESFPNLEVERKASEKDLLLAYTNSHANEINCYNSIKEAIILQKELTGIYKEENYGKKNQ